MQSNSTSKIKSPVFDSFYVTENEVPKGFISWYEIQEKNNSKILSLLDTYLFNNELHQAISLFQIATQENVEKIWH